MKTALLMVALTAGIAVMTVKHAKARRELLAVRTLTQERQAELDRLHTLNAELRHQLEAGERSRDDTTELLRLRGEVAKLRREVSERTAAAQTATQPDIAPAEPESQLQFHCRLWLTREKMPGMTGVLDGLQSNAFIGMLEKTYQAEKLAEGNVTTLSGRQAQLQWFDGELASAGYTNIGSAVDIFATQVDNTRQLQLDLAAQIRALVWNTSANTTPVPAILTGITNSIAILDGSTLAMTAPISVTGHWTVNGQGVGFDGPRTLVLMITPTLIDPAGNPRFIEPVQPEPNENRGIFPGTLDPVVHSVED
jgi:hypothetical protein